MLFDTCFNPAPDLSVFQTNTTEDRNYTLIVALQRQIDALRQELQDLRANSAYSYSPPMEFTYRG